MKNTTARKKKRGEKSIVTSENQIAEVLNHTTNKLFSLKQKKKPTKNLNHHEKTSGNLIIIIFFLISILR